MSQATSRRSRWPFRDLAPVRPRLLASAETSATKRLSAWRKSLRTSSSLSSASMEIAENAPVGPEYVRRRRGRLRFGQGAEQAGHGAHALFHRPPCPKFPGRDRQPSGGLSAAYTPVRMSNPLLLSKNFCNPFAVPAEVPGRRCRAQFRPQRFRGERRCNLAGD